MIKRILKKRALAASVLIGLLLGYLPCKSQSIAQLLQPAIKSAGFKMDGYFLWCPSVIRVGSTYHMFASRWPAQYGMNGWSTYSEVVHATANTLLGPYTFKEVVLQKRPDFWDKVRAHNPKIVKAGNKFVLYYISTANSTGYAWADNIDGPWTRCDSVAMPFSNPAPLVKKDGSVYVLGRKNINGVRIAQAYTAPAFNGKYTLVNDGSNVLPGKNGLEDPTIWSTNNQYNVICSDFAGDVTGIVKNGVQYCSKDGISYTPLSTQPVYTKTVIYDDGTTEIFKRRERPFIYIDEKQQPIAFFTACLPADGAAYIVAQPIKNVK